MRSALEKCSRAQASEWRARACTAGAQSASTSKPPHRLRRQNELFKITRLLNRPRFRACVSESVVDCKPGCLRASYKENTSKQMPQSLFRVADVEYAPRVPLYPHRIARCPGIKIEAAVIKVGNAPNIIL